jgi:hypothetical protein
VNCCSRRALIGDGTQALHDGVSIRSWNDPRMEHTPAIAITGPTWKPVHQMSGARPRCTRPVYLAQPQAMEAAASSCCTPTSGSRLGVSLWPRSVAYEHVRVGSEGHGNEMPRRWL